MGRGHLVSEVKVTDHLWTEVGKWISWEKRRNMWEAEGGSEKWASWRKTKNRALQTICQDGNGEDWVLGGYCDEESCREGISPYYPVCMHRPGCAAIENQVSGLSCSNEKALKFLRDIPRGNPLRHWLSRGHPEGGGKRTESTSERTPPLGIPRRGLALTGERKPEKNILNLLASPRKS